jgi:hypothetical protein
MDRRPEHDGGDPRRVDPDAADGALAGALAALGAAPAVVEVDAGFFHRTLARWLGLPEGRGPRSSLPPVEWDYAFWKAELTRDPDDDTSAAAADAADAGARREHWSALLYRMADEAPLRVAWTVDKDGRGAIVGSSWRTAAPQLFAARPSDDAVVDGDADLDPAMLARLVDADAP